MTCIVEEQSPVLMANMLLDEWRTVLMWIHFQLVYGEIHNNHFNYDWIKVFGISNKQ